MDEWMVGRMDDWMHGWTEERRRRPGLSPDTRPPVHPSSRTTSAFTLIELLVVVAVIGILAGLVMPLVARAMKTTSAVHCKSNLKQIAAGFVLYTKQYQGFMAPLGSPTSSPPYRFPRWYDNLTPFLQDVAIFQCPAKKRVTIGYALSHMWSGPDHIYGEGYAMNNRSKEFEQVTNPSGTIIICDTGYVSNPDDPPADWEDGDSGGVSAHIYFPYDNRPGEPGSFPYYRTDPRRCVPRHVGAKTNCMFFDNHVEGIETADIVDDIWDEPGCLYDNDGHPKRK